MDVAPGRICDLVFCGEKMSKIELKAAEPASPEILDYLAENESVHLHPRSELDHESVHFLTVRDGGELVFVCSWVIAKRGPLTDVEIGAVNGSRAKNMKWIEPLVKAFDQIADLAGAGRVVVPVARPAIAMVLEKLGYVPLPIKLLMKAA